MESREGLGSHSFSDFARFGLGSSSMAWLIEDDVVGTSARS